MRAVVNQARLWCLFHRNGVGMVLAFGVIALMAPLLYFVGVPAGPPVPIGSGTIERFSGMGAKHGSYALVRTQDGVYAIPLRGWDTCQIGGQVALERVPYILRSRVRAREGQPICRLKNEGPAPL